MICQVNVIMVHAMHSCYNYYISVLGNGQDISGNEQNGTQKEQSDKVDDGCSTTKVSYLCTYKVEEEEEERRSCVGWEDEKEEEEEVEL